MASQIKLDLIRLQAIQVGLIVFWFGMNSPSNKANIYQDPRSIRDCVLYCVKS